MRELLQNRARMFQDIRAFFYQRGVLEVETPALSIAGNTDPAIESFSVPTSTGKRFLHTSPEYPMKRLLAAGSGDIYQICKVWRADECGRLHNPEFTLLEWYRTGFNWRQLMQEVAELLQFLLPELDSTPQFVSYGQVMLEVAGIDPHHATTEQLEACVERGGFDLVGECDRRGLLDLLMSHMVEPALKPDQLTFIYDYPAEQCALAMVSDENPPVAKRFEVYANGLELANGYQELTNAAANREVLQRDADSRLKNGQMKVPVDEYFLLAAYQGIPPCAGVAMGLDRVLMCQLGKKTIEDVISFPWRMA